MQDYSAFLRRVVRAMVPRVSTPEVEAIALEDAVRDAGGPEGLLSYSQFFDAMFELGTLWCASQTPAAGELRLFLASLRAAVCGLRLSTQTQPLPFPASAEDIAMFIKAYGPAVLDASPCLLPEQSVQCRPSIAAWRAAGDEAEAPTHLPASSSATMHTTITPGVVQLIASDPIRAPPTSLAAAIRAPPSPAPPTMPSRSAQPNNESGLAQRRKQVLSNLMLTSSERSDHASAGDRAVVTGSHSRAASTGAGISEEALALATAMVLPATADTAEEGPGSSRHEALSHSPVRGIRSAVQGSAGPLTVASSPALHARPAAEQAGMTEVLHGSIQASSDSATAEEEHETQQLLRAHHSLRSILMATKPHRSTTVPFEAEIDEGHAPGLSLRAPAENTPHGVPAVGASAASDSSQSPSFQHRMARVNKSGTVNKRHMRRNTPMPGSMAAAARGAAGAASNGSASRPGHTNLASASLGIQQLAEGDEDEEESDEGQGSEEEGDSIPPMPSLGTDAPVSRPAPPAIQEGKSEEEDSEGEQDPGVGSAAGAVHAPQASDVPLEVPCLPHLARLGKHSQLALAVPQHSNNKSALQCSVLPGDVLSLLLRAAGLQPKAGHASTALKQGAVQLESGAVISATQVQRKPLPASGHVTFVDRVRAAPKAATPEASAELGPATLHSVHTALVDPLFRVVFHVQPASSKAQKPQRVSVPVGHPALPVEVWTRCPGSYPAAHALCLLCRGAGKAGLVQEMHLAAETAATARVRSVTGDNMQHSSVLHSSSSDLEERTTDCRKEEPMRDFIAENADVQAPEDDLIQPLHAHVRPGIAGDMRKVPPRVVVTGPSGSGRTTAAKKLALALGVRYIEPSVLIAEAVSFPAGWSAPDVARQNLKQADIAAVALCEEDDTPALNSRLAQATAVRGDVSAPALAALQEHREQHSGATVAQVGGTSAPPQSSSNTSTSVVPLPYASELDSLPVDEGVAEWWSGVQGAEAKAGAKHIKSIEARAKKLSRAKAKASRSIDNQEGFDLFDIEGEVADDEAQWTRELQVRHRVGALSAQLAAKRPLYSAIEDPRSVLGQLADAHLRRGDTVPASIVLALVRDAMLEAVDAGTGYVLDGYPASVEEFKALKTALGTGIVRGVQLYEWAQEVKAGVAAHRHLRARKVARDATGDALDVLVNILGPSPRFGMDPVALGGEPSEGLGIDMSPVMPGAEVAGDEADPMGGQLPRISHGISATAALSSEERSAALAAAAEALASTPAGRPDSRSSSRGGKSVTISERSNKTKHFYKALPSATASRSGRRPPMGMALGESGESTSAVGVLDVSRGAGKRPWESVCSDCSMDGGHAFALPSSSTVYVGPQVAVLRAVKDVLPLQVIALTLPEAEAVAARESVLTDPVSGLRYSAADQANKLQCPAYDETRLDTGAGEADPAAPGYSAATYLDIFAPGDADVEESARTIALAEFQAEKSTVDELLRSVLSAMMAHVADGDSAPPQGVALPNVHELEVEDAQRLARFTKQRTQAGHAVVLSCDAPVDPSTGEVLADVHPEGARALGASFAALKQQPQGDNEVTIGLVLQWMREALQSNKEAAQECLRAAQQAGVETPLAESTPAGGAAAGSVASDAKSDDDEGSEAEEEAAGNDKASAEDTPPQSLAEWLGLPEGFLEEDLTVEDLESALPEGTMQTLHSIAAELNRLMADTSAAYLHGALYSCSEHKSAQRKPATGAHAAFESTQADLAKRLQAADDAEEAVEGDTLDEAEVEAAAPTEASAAVLAVLNGTAGGETLARVRGLLRRLYLGMRSRQLAKAEREMPRLGFKAFRPVGAVRSGVAALYVRAPAGLTVGGLGSRAYGLAANPLLLHMLGGLPAEQDKSLPGSFHAGLEDADEAPEEDVEAGYALFKAASLAAAASVQRSRLDAQLARSLYRAFAEIIPFEAAAQVGALRRPGAAVDAMLSGAAVPLGSVLDEDEQVIPEQLPAVLVRRPEDAAENVRWDCLEWAQEEGPLMQAFEGVAKAVTRVDATQTPAEVFVHALLGLCEGVLPAYSRLGVPPPRPAPLRLPADLAPAAMPTLEEAEGAAGDGASEFGGALPVRSAAETLAGEDMGHVAAAHWAALAQWDAIVDGGMPAPERSAGGAGIALGKRDLHSASSQGSSKDDPRAVVPGSDMLPFFFGHHQPGRDTLPMNTPDNEAMAFLMYGPAAPRRFDREVEAALDGRFVFAPSSSVHPEVLSTVGGTWVGRFTPEWVPTGSAEGYDVALQDRASWAVWLSRVGHSVALRREIEALKWWADAQLMQRSMAACLSDEGKRDKWYMKKAIAAEKAAIKSKSSSSKKRAAAAAAAGDNDPEVHQRLLGDVQAAVAALQQPALPKAAELLPQFVKFIASLRQRALVASLAAAAEAVVATVPRVPSTSLLAVLPGSGAGLDSGSEGTSSAAGTPASVLAADSGHPLAFFLSPPTDPSAVTLVAGLGGASGDEEALDEKEAAANDDLDAVRRVAGARAFGILGVGLPDDAEVGDEPDEEVETAPLLLRFQWWSAAVASAVDALVIEELRDDDAVAGDVAQVLDAEGEAAWFDETDAAERLLAAAGESVPLELRAAHKHKKAARHTSENDAIAHRSWVRAARARARGWRARARDQHRRLSPFGLACPVAFSVQGAVRQGLPQFASHFKGFLFLFASAAAKACFLRSPAQYLTAKPTVPKSSAKVAISGAQLSGMQHTAASLCSQLGLTSLDVVGMLSRRLQAVAEQGGVLIAPLTDAQAISSSASRSEISGASEREDLSPRSKARKQRKTLPEALQVLGDVPASLSHRAAWVLAQGKPLPGPLLAAVIVEELERMAESPVPQPVPGAGAGGAVGEDASADLAVDRLLAAMEAAVLEVRTSHLTEEMKLRRKALAKAKVGKAGYSDSEVAKAQRRAEEEERWFAKQLELAERQLDEEEEQCSAEGWTSPAGFVLPASGWCLSSVPVVPAVWRALLRRGVVPDTVVLLDVTSHTRPAVHTARRIMKQLNNRDGLAADEALLLHAAAFDEAGAAARDGEPSALLAQSIVLQGHVGTPSDVLVDAIVAGDDLAPAIASFGLGGEDAPETEQPEGEAQELWSAEAALRYRDTLQATVPLSDQTILPTAAAMESFQGQLSQVANILRRHRVQVVVVPAGAGYSNEDVQTMARAAVDPFVSVLEPQAWWNTVWTDSMDWMATGANVGATGAGQDSVDADDNAGTVLSLGPYGRYCPVTAVTSGMLLPVQEISAGEATDSEHSPFASSLALANQGGIGSTAARVNGSTWLFADSRNRRFFDMHSGALARLGPQGQRGTLLTPPRTHCPIIMPLLPAGVEADAELAAVASQFTPALHMESVLARLLGLWVWQPQYGGAVDQQAQQEMQVVWYNRRRVLRAALREVWGGADTWLAWLRASPQFAAQLSAREQFEEGLLDWQGHSTMLPFEYDFDTLFDSGSVDSSAVDKAVRSAQLAAAGQEAEEEEEDEEAGLQEENGEEEEPSVALEPLDMDLPTATTIVAALVSDVLRGVAGMAQASSHSGVLLRDLPPMSSDLLTQIVTTFRAAPTLVLPIALPGATAPGAAVSEGAAAALALQRLQRELQWQPDEETVATVKAEQSAQRLYSAVEGKLLALQAQLEQEGTQRGRSVHVRGPLTLEEAPEASLSRSDVEDLRKEAVEEAIAQLQEEVVESVAAVHEAADAAKALGLVTLPAVAWDPTVHLRSGVDQRAVSGISAAVGQFVPQLRASTSHSLAAASRLHKALVQGSTVQREAAAALAFEGSVQSASRFAATDLFAGASVVTPSLADCLLHAGLVRASKLGGFCPVQLASKGAYVNSIAASAGLSHGSIPLTAVPDAGAEDGSPAGRVWLRRALRTPAWVPVLYKSVLYCLSSLPAAVAFARSPESFLQSVPAAPPTTATATAGTVQAAVVGPPCSGKTSVCASLARRTGAVHVSVQGVLHWVMARPTWSLARASSALTGPGTVASVTAAVQRSLLGSATSAYLTASSSSDAASAAVQSGVLCSAAWVGALASAAPVASAAAGGIVNDTHLLARAVACFIRSVASAGRGWVLDGFPTSGSDIAMLADVCGVTVPQIVVLQSDAAVSLNRAQSRLAREATRLALGLGVAPTQQLTRRACKVLGAAAGDDQEEATEHLQALLSETLLFGDANEDADVDAEEAADFEAEGQRGVDLPAGDVAPVEEDTEEAADHEVGWMGVGGLWQPGTGGRPARSTFAQGAAEGNRLFSLEAAVEAAEAMAEAYDADAEEEAAEEAADACAIAVSVGDVALPAALQRRRRGWHTAVTGESMFVSASGHSLSLPHDTPQKRDNSPGLQLPSNKSVGFFASDGRTLVHGPRSAHAAGGPTPLSDTFMLSTYRRDLLKWNTAEAALLHSAQRHFGGVSRVSNSAAQQLSDVSREVTARITSGQAARLVLAHARATMRASSLQDTGVSALDALQRLSPAVSSFCPVSWVERRLLVDALACPAPLQHAAEYRGVVYLLASASCLVKFLAAPTRYLSRATLPPGGALPVRVPLHAVPDAATVARADVHAMGGKAELLRGGSPADPQVLAAATEAQRLLALGGLCPVSVMQATQQRLPLSSAKYGLRSMSVLYKGRLFQCADERSVATFMQRPHIYEHLCSPVHSPPPPQLAEHKLPAHYLLQAAAAGKLESGTIGFLSQAVAPLLERALVSMADELPHLKHPTLSKQATAKRYLALFLAAYNPHAKAHVRARGRTALTGFISACKLPLAWKSAAEEAGVQGSSVSQAVPKFAVGRVVQAQLAGQWQGAEIIGEPRFMFAQNCYKIRFADGSVDSAVKESSLREVEGGDADMLTVQFQELRVPLPVQLPQPSMHRFQVGDLVEALYAGKGAMRYRARITAIALRSRQATYTVLYADGETQQLPESALRVHSVAGHSPRSSFRPSQSLPGNAAPQGQQPASSGAAQSMGPPGGDSPLAGKRFVRPQPSHTTIRMPQKPASMQNWHQDPVATPPRAPPGQLLTGASPLPSSSLALAAQYLLPHKGNSTGAGALAEQRKAVANLVLSRRVRATDDALDVMGYEADKVMKGQGSDPVAEGTLKF